MRVDDHAFDDFARWLNEWGDLDQRGEERCGPTWRDGYQDAIRDVYKRFAQVPTRLDPEDEAA